MKKINYLVSVFSIFGAIVGAGFMTGAEIFAFFSRFGAFGYVGILVNCVLYAGFGIVYGFKFASDNYCETNTHKKSYVMCFCQLLIAACMVAGLCEMLGKFGAGQNAIWVVMVVLFLCLCVGIKIASVVNVCVSAFLIFSVAFLMYDGEFTFLIEGNGHIIFAILMACFYAVMNMAGSESMVAHVCKKKTKKEIVIIFVTFGVMLFLLLILLGGIVNDKSSMPLVETIKNKTFKNVYSIMVIVAMVSTLLSAGFGAKNMFNFGNVISSALVSILCGIFSFVGFENIVKFVYPTIGFVLVFEYILTKILKNSKY